MSLRVLLSIGLLCAGTWSGLAAASNEDAAIRAAVARLAPGAQIEWIQDSASPTLKIVKLQGTSELAALSTDGRVMIPAPAAVIDVSLGADEIGLHKARIMREAIEKVPSSSRLVYPAPRKKHTLVVFTDLDCGYCKRLHTQMDAFNRAGITIEYLFFARNGASSPTFAKHASVLCAGDRHLAMDRAVAGAPMTPSSCNSPLEAMQEAGEMAGTNGTPTVVLPDGTQIGGFVTPEQALQAIERADQMKRMRTP